MALKSADKEVTRVNVDIADYKKQRANRLEEKAQAWLDEVKKSGEDKHLPPMNSADRRTIHKLADDNGFLTESEGQGRDRHIVLKATASDDSSEDAAGTSPEPETPTNTDEPEGSIEDTKEFL